ncbi:MAG: hypothetical protein EKK54_08125 [Neisseriaceae bacterium]|nr:MAG: hypothetical protein EKK54_08125 [Neisseriaceae bacterium]
MATKILSINVPDNYSAITVATGSATTAALELTYDLTKVTSKAQLLKMLENLEQRIVLDNFPPANT